MKITTIALLSLGLAVLVSMAFCLPRKLWLANLRPDTYIIQTCSVSDKNCVAAAGQQADHISYELHNPPWYVTACGCDYREALLP